MSWLGYWDYDWTKFPPLEPEMLNRRFRNVSDRLRMLEPRLLPYFLLKWKYPLAPQRARDDSRRFGLCSGPLLRLVCIGGPFSTIQEGRVKRTPEFTTWWTLSSLCEKLSQSHLFYIRKTPWAHRITRPLRCSSFKIKSINITVPQRNRQLTSLQPCAYSLASTICEQNLDFTRKFRASLDAEFVELVPRTKCFSPSLP